MMYAVLCYNNEEMVCGWTREQDDAVMAALSKVHDKWEGAGKLKPSIRLLPTTAATTLHKAKDMVIDGPYAETKEALLGFYIIDVADLDEGLAFARELSAANPGGAYELRPIHLYLPGAPIDGAYEADREYADDKATAK
ncbi:MAG: YciI family protein [Hyphomonadaceae bacterium]